MMAQPPNEDTAQVHAPGGPTPSLTTAAAVIALDVLTLQAAVNLWGDASPAVDLARLIVAGLAVTALLTFGGVRPAALGLTYPTRANMIAGLAGPVTVVAGALIAHALIFGGNRPADAMPPSNPMTGPWLALYLWRAVMVAPLLEETLYRGVLVCSVAERLSPRTALLASAVAFAELHRHYGWPREAWGYYALVGFLLAWTRLGPAGLPGAIVLHAALNLVVLARDLTA